MTEYNRKELIGEKIYIGLDLHRKMWYVTIRTAEVELFKGSIVGCWEALKELLERYRNNDIEVVYEAGYFGYWIYDEIIQWGAKCIVTPPSLIPLEYGNMVKTDKRDSRKLAFLLAKGMLKRIYVPTPEERAHRNVIRRRRQLIQDRVRVQNRIKAELRFNGIELPEPKGPWPKHYVVNLGRVRFRDRYQQMNFQHLLDEYKYLTQLIDQQSQLVREMSEAELYKSRVQILRSIPGVGLIGAMEILLELQDVARFRRAEQLAAYVGLTPSQYSSANKVRMGRITGVGKNTLRAILVEASWKLISKDAAMRAKYERIKIRAGGKRAIVAVARNLLIRARRILLDGVTYQVSAAA
jgi:transposase